uniref:BTB_2 domain-containing protein n=1 Tax=Loa loa TaxID=7209 RepID=A0A1I7VCI6_LOALO
MATSTRGIRRKNRYTEHQNDQMIRRSICISQFLKDSQTASLNNNHIMSVINDIIISTNNDTETEPQSQMGLIVDSNNVDAFLRLNIGGTHFLIRNETVLRRQIGLLSLIVQWPHEKRILLVDAYLENTKEYYFERSALLFNVIYQFYLTGLIHLPENLCLKDLLNELNYWCIAPDKYLAECCCFDKNNDQLDSIKSSSEMDQADHFRHLRFGEYRLQIWNLIEMPSRFGRSNYRPDELSRSIINP